MGYGKITDKQREILEYIKKRNFESRLSAFRPRNL